MGNSSVKMKIPNNVEEVEQGKSILTPFLSFIVFLWDGKIDVLL